MGFFSSLFLVVGLVVSFLFPVVGVPLLLAAIVLQLGHIERGHCGSNTHRREIILDVG